MLAVEKWAQDKNPIITFFAISLALMARLQCEALRNIKERSVFGHIFPLPPLPIWFAMYRSRKPLLAYNRLIYNNSDSTDQLLKLFSQLRKLDKTLRHNPSMPIKPPPPKEVVTAVAMWESMCLNIFADIAEEISGSEPNKELHLKFLDAIKRDVIPLSFYYLVYIPCILSYWESPSIIYRKAINGDLLAVEQLLKLDPLILHDPSIGFQIQSVRMKGKLNKYENLLKAATKHPTIRYKSMVDARKTIKSDYAAKIYVTADLLKNPLQTPEIQALFDALAQEFESTLVDTDITSTEGFETTIRTKSAQGQDLFRKPEKQK